ncbi:MAG TPA: 2Fe-2S iron-sulfur cluster-binding protein [Anaerolineaceae bacterium]|nr:2Fe-2S iron-sulfur cluster-binding protein [Anaerolineaceae bacterium]
MASQPVTLFIDGKQIQADATDTILMAAANAGIKIPTICFHNFCTSNALCRICVVEIEGARTLVPACIGKVAEGMKIQTQSERVRLSRRLILEMLASTIDLSQAPDILNMMPEYDADPARFPDAEQRNPPIIDDNPMYIRDYSKCILCWRCVQVCAEDAQYTYAINFSQRGFNTQISTFYDLPLPETTCVFCGQCIGVCPTGALRPKREWLLELGYSPAEIMRLTRQERKHRTPRETQTDKES